MIKNILVPYDGSGQSTRAFEFALDIAKKYNSHITIMTCILAPSNVDPIMAKAYQETLKIQKEEALKSLSSLESKLKSSGIIYILKVLEAVSIIDVLLSYAGKKLCRPYNSWLTRTGRL